MKRHESIEVAARELVGFLFDRRIDLASPLGWRTKDLASALELSVAPVSRRSARAALSRIADMPWESNSADWCAWAVNVASEALGEPPMPGGTAEPLRSLNCQPTQATVESKSTEEDDHRALHGWRE